jgi:hypothetical protein
VPVQNLISATAALLATLPRASKLSPADTFQPTTPLTESYTLAWTFAALYSNATVSLNSVAGDNIDLVHATTQSAPTILLASPATVSAYLKHPSTTLPSGVGKFMTQRTLSQGIMPGKTPSAANPLSHLRVLLIPQSVSAPKSSRLDSSTIHALRTHLKCRVGYALTASHVAGAISQTNVFDYRDKGPKVISVGAPLGSVEVHLMGDEGVVGGRAPRGVVSHGSPVCSTCYSIAPCISLCNVY